MRTTVIFLLALCAPACAHESVSAGIDTAQRGMAIVDVATESLTDKYSDAVKKTRAYCRGDKECEERYHVTDSEVEKVLEAAELLSGAYDTAAMSLRHMRDAWSVLGPALERMEDDVASIAAEATP